MLIIDIILYTVITWYLDAVLPGAFGTPQPFYFPFTVLSISFWFYFFAIIAGEVQIFWFLASIT